MQRTALSRQAGFTMIELVMVIVIIGILAAFALPRFANLGSNARASAVQGAAGAVASAAAIAHAQWLIGGGANTSAQVVLEGVTVTTDTASGFPTADAAGIGKAAGLDTAVFVPTAAADPQPFQHVNGKTKANCQFTYDADTGEVVTDVTDC